MKTPIQPMSQLERWKSLSKEEQDQWVKIAAENIARSSEYEGIPLDREALEKEIRKAFEDETNPGASFKKLPQEAAKATPQK